MAQIAENSQEALLRDLRKATSPGKVSDTAGEALASLTAVAAVGTDWTDAGLAVEAQVGASGILAVTLSGTLTVSSGTGVLYLGYTLLGPSPRQGVTSGSEAAAPDVGRALATDGVMAAGLTITHTGLIPGWYVAAARYRGLGTIAYRRMRLTPG